MKYKTSKNTAREKSLLQLQVLLCYEFKNKNLLEEATTHSSFANELKNIKFNERLEFLGDAVLELVITDKLYRLFPEKKEGTLSFLRAKLVCEKNLNSIAEKLELNKLLRVGKDYRPNLPTASMMADCLEALFGAIYLDGGYNVTERIILELIKPDAIILEKAEKNIENAIKSPKNILQEMFQKNGGTPPQYKTVEKKGPDNALEYRVQISVEGNFLAEAWGSSQKRAGAAAAEIAIAKLTGNK